MAVSPETREFVIEADKILIDLVQKEFNALTQHINKNFEYVSKRFDDIDRRLHSLELKTDQASKDTHEHLEILRKDTAILPDVFAVLEQDGIDMGDLEARVSKLES